MIVEAILSLIFSFFGFIISLIPENILSNNVFDTSGFTSFISNAFVIFPSNLFLVIVANITFWLGVQMLWAIIEWVYKKIPGVN